MGKNDVHLVYLVELLRALLIMWRLLGRVALQLHEHISCRLGGCHFCFLLFLHDNLNLLVIRFQILDNLERGPPLSRGKPTDYSYREIIQRDQLPRHQHIRFGLRNCSLLSFLGYCGIRLRSCSLRIAPDDDVLNVLFSVDYGCSNCLIPRRRAKTPAQANPEVV